MEHDLSELRTSPTVSRVVAGMDLSSLFARAVFAVSFGFAIALIFGMIS